MRFLLSLGIACLLFPLGSLAAEVTLFCDAPQGTRIDYFSTNTINLQNQTFLMGRDKMSGMRPRVVLNENRKEVFFIIGDTEQLKSSPKSGNMKVLIYDENQISFVGLVNGAPILATYYPKMNILIYSQQAIWPGPNYEGARAVIFYSKCSQQNPA